MVVVDVVAVMLKGASVVASLLVFVVRCCHGGTFVGLRDDD